MPDAQYFKEVGLSADIADKLESLQALTPMDFPGTHVQFQTCLNLNEFKGKTDEENKWNVLSEKRGFDIRHFTDDSPGRHTGETNFERQNRVKEALRKEAQAIHDPNFKNVHKNRGLKETIALWKAANQFSRSWKAQASECELLGILLYTSGWYQYMNPLMRGYLDVASVPREVITHLGHSVLWATSGIEKISKVQVERSDYPGISYRVDLSNEYTNDGRSVGEVFWDNALSSSTTELSGGYTMASEKDGWDTKTHCITVFRPAKGRKFIGGLDVGFRSWFGLEQSELLFRPSTRWKVVRKVFVAGTLERLHNIAINAFATMDEVAALRESVAKVRANKNPSILNMLRYIVVVEQVV